LKRGRSAELARPTLTAEAATAAAIAAAATITTVAATATAAAITAITATATAITAVTTTAAAAVTTTAAAATVATAAATTTTTAKATATAALLFACLVHDETATFEGIAVERADGVLGFVGTRHGDEAEAAGATGFAIGDDAGIGHFAVGAEQLGELSVGGPPGQVADIDLRGHQIILETERIIAFRGEAGQRIVKCNPARSQDMPKMLAWILRNATLP
jgi:hypothetical protein